jgi:hypothetical protein
MFTRAGISYNTRTLVGALKLRVLVLEALNSAKQGDGLGNRLVVVGREQAQCSILVESRLD